MIFRAVKYQSIILLPRAAGRTDKPIMTTSFSWRSGGYPGIFLAQEALLPLTVKRHTIADSQPLQGSIPRKR